MKTKILYFITIVVWINVFIGIIPSIVIVFILLLTQMYCLNKYDASMLFILYGTIIGAFFVQQGVRFIGVLFIIPSLLFLLYDLRAKLNLLFHIFTPVLVVIIYFVFSILITSGGDFAFSKLTTTLLNLTYYIIALSHFFLFRSKHNGVNLSLMICIYCLFVIHFMNETIGYLPVIDNLLSSFGGFRDEISIYKYNEENAFTFNYQMVGTMSCLALCMLQMKDNYISKRLSKYVLYALTFFIVLFSTSRQSLLAYLILSAIFVYKQNQSKIYVLFITTLGIGIFIYWISTLDMNSVQFLLGDNEFTSTGSRNLIMNTAFDNFIESPFYGVGFGRFSYMGEYGLNEHNLFVELLAETGIVGLLMFFLISYLPLKRKNKFIIDNSELIPIWGIYVTYFVRYMISSDLRESIILLVLVLLMPYYKCWNKNGEEQNSLHLSKFERF